MLAGCGSLTSPTDTSESQVLTPEQREAVVIESKVGRYFDLVKDDRTSLSAFLNHMPKGGDVRLYTVWTVPPTQLQAALPLTEADYRSIITHAVTQRIGYLEVMVNVTPEHIAQLDAIQQQVAKEYADKGLGFDVTVNYLACVDANFPIARFKEELKAAVALYQSSERIVGITVIPATGAYSYDVFLEQLAAIDEVYRANGGTDGLPAGDSKAPRFSIPLDAATLSKLGYEGARESLAPALKLGHPLRIDFCASAALEGDLYQLVTDMAKSEPGVTVSFTVVPAPGVANPVASDVSAYRLFSSMGVPATLVTDNGTGSYIELSDAYLTMALAHRMSYTDLKALAYKSLDASLLSIERQQEERKKLDDAFKQFELGMSQTIDELKLLN
jgi:hypothetical protein